VYTNVSFDIHIYTHIYIHLFSQAIVSAFSLFDASAERDHPKVVLNPLSRQVCCSALHCVAEWCSVLQCVVLCCRVV